MLCDAAFCSATWRLLRKDFQARHRKNWLGNLLRADADIFGTGKIIDQIWRGINAAKVLVAELTTRNANVLYELGLAHALRKPVVLVSSNQPDVPFDLNHIRAIYYDVSDPFLGSETD